MTELEKTYAEQIAEKRKKKKIWISSVALSFVLLLAVAIITLACVKVDLKPNSVTNPSRIYFNAEKSIQYDADDKLYQDFMSEYESTFEISTLSAMFTGRLGGYEIEENQLKSLPSTVTEGIYVTFLYNTKQTLTRPNGKTYYSIYNSNYSIDFTEVTFVLSDEDKQGDLTMYLKYNWNVKGTGSGTDYYAEINLSANIYGLYQIYQNK